MNNVQIFRNALCLLAGLAILSSVAAVSAAPLKCEDPDCGHGRTAKVLKLKSGLTGQTAAKLKLPQLKATALKAKALKTSPLKLPATKAK